MLRGDRVEGSGAAPCWGWCPAAGALEPCHVGIGFCLLSSSVCLCGGRFFLIPITHQINRSTITVIIISMSKCLISHSACCCPKVPHLPGTQSHTLCFTDVVYCQCTLSLSRPSTSPGPLLYSPGFGGGSMSQWRHIVSVVQSWDEVDGPPRSPPHAHTHKRERACNGACVCEGGGLSPSLPLSQNLSSY